MPTHRRSPGAGSVTQLPDGRFMARLDLGWKDGKRQRKAVFGRTKAEALKKLAKVRADNDQIRSYRRKAFRSVTFHGTSLRD